MSAAGNAGSPKKLAFWGAFDCRAMLLEQVVDVVDLHSPFCKAQCWRRAVVVYVVFFNKQSSLFFIIAHKKTHRSAFPCLSPFTFRLSPFTSNLSPFVYNLSPIAEYSSPFLTIINRPSRSIFLTSSPLASSPISSTSVLTDDTFTRIVTYSSIASSSLLPTS